MPLGQRPFECDLAGQEPAPGERAPGSNQASPLLLFIAEPWWAKVLGGVTVALILVRALRHATSRPPQVLGRAARRTEPEAPAQE